ncbi:hypothetical protein VKT23_018698 [Stygiomarasmius scandens]|uniref:Uncharacterized protein n=1 Tax=Marasmiellus scandens TaxID=2682957 RepID=A0ABR1IQJ8_9AGAR
MIAAMIMESSILYSVAIIAGVVSMYAHNILASEIAVNAQTQLVGIAPTLLVVRVGLGVDLKDVVNSVNIMSMVHSRDLEDQSTEISEEDLDLESEEVPTAIMETWTTNRSGDLTEVGSSLLRPEMSKETVYLKSQIFYPQK